MGIKEKKEMGPRKNREWGTKVTDPSKKRRKGRNRILKKQQQRGEERR